MKKQLAAFLSFFQINLGTLEPHGKMLQCDCNLFDLKTFIYQNLPIYQQGLVLRSIYPHSLMLSASNFQMWKCQVHPVLMLDVTQGSFLLMKAESFICKDNSLKCPDKCDCYMGANDSRRIIDCRNRSLSELPRSILLPPSMSQLIVSVEHNNIVHLPECDDPHYEWLKNVTTFNIQHNELTPSNIPLFDRFLHCMKNVSSLFLAYNNIQYFPPYIQQMDFDALSISGNKLTCCNSHWMKIWLQEKNRTIQNSLIVHCIDKGKVILFMPDQAREINTTTKQSVTDRGSL